VIFILFWITVGILIGFVIGVALCMNSVDVAERERRLARQQLADIREAARLEELRQRRMALRELTERMEISS
jgi:hypothetical protein